MCFKYEGQYGSGWDYMEWGEGPQQLGNLIKFLRDEWEVEMGPSGSTVFLKEFFKFCEQMHERGIIKPSEDG